MTNAEIKKILDEKVAFMEEINKAIKKDRNSIENVKLDVFEHPVYGTQEYLVITFKGGALSVRDCVANSNLANLEEFTKMCFGGYYSEVRHYKQLKEESQGGR